MNPVRKMLRQLPLSKRGKNLNQLFMTRNPDFLHQPFLVLLNERLSALQQGLSF